MKTLGYVNQFGMGLRTAKETLEHYDCKPAEYILDDRTTFRVVVYSSDYEINNADVTDNVTDNVIDNVTGKNLLLMKGDTLFFSICLIINMFLRRS